MMHLSSLKLLVVGVVLVGTSVASVAMTLGRSRGAAVLGQSLELTISVQMDEQEAAASPCFDAEVFYGESKQEAKRVNVLAQAPVQGSAWQLKVTSTASVDEPVVTVYLHAGCGQKATRRYVLLADVASEVSPPVILAAAPATLAIAVPRVSPPALPATGVLPTTVQRAKELGGVRKSEEPPVRAARAAKNSHQAKITAKKTAKVAGGASGSNRARLKLAAVDLPESEPVLKLSSELKTDPTEDLKKRADAVALWRSLSATPEEHVQREARTATLEADLRALQAQTARTQALMADMTARIEKAESQRYANPLVYGLLVVLAALAAGLLFAWRSLRGAAGRAAPWWSDSEQAARSDARSDEPRNLVSESNKAQLQLLDPDTGPAGDSEGASSAWESEVSQVDIDLGLPGSAFAPVTPMEPIAPMEPFVPMLPVVPMQPIRRSHDGGIPRDFSQSVAGTLRAINTQEMLDVRQQADFFMTLGQYEDAIDLLVGSITDSGESNPLVYLDLLKVLHTLSRKDEFDHYRDEFNRLFTGHVPVYVAFNRVGRSLDAYPEVCDAVSEFWPSQEALEVIEGYLVRSPMGEAKHELDLEAFRDLLMLHSVAGRMAGATESRLVPFSASRPASVPDSSTNAVPLVSDIPLGVDLDLSEPTNNLIDFEISGFSQSTLGTLPKP